MDPAVTTVVLVPLIAVAAALLTTAIGRWVKIPLVVFEIVLGLIIGPSVLGWVHETGELTALSNFGLAFLFFMAGNEIDFAAIGARRLRKASLLWVVSLAVGILAAALIAGDAVRGVYLGIALTSTALGTLMPVLRDAGELRTPFGRAVTAVGAVGEFGPLLAISLFLSGRRPLAAALVLIGFAVIAGGAIWFASRGGHRRFHDLVRSTLHTSGQFAVRFVVLIIAALVGLSIALGLDMLLGAFAAGVLSRILLAGAEPADAHQIESKLEAVAFGVLVPIFFINTGIGFDLQALLGDPRALILLPIFLVLLIVVRGIPASFSASPGSPPRDRGSLTLFAATGLPIIVAVTQIGVADHELPVGTATALVAAGMLSVLIFPLVALTMRRRSPDGGIRPADPDSIPVEG